jgi:hypothetical protein
MSDLPERICGECGLPISVCNAVAVIREARKRGHEIPEIAAKDAEIARLRREVAAAEAAALERAADAAYRVCAETRHVTLGDKAAEAIRALAKLDGGEG